MFIGKPMQTIASREPDRQRIIRQTATFLEMGGRISGLEIEKNRQVPTSDLEKHAPKYRSRGSEAARDV